MGFSFEEMAAAIEVYPNAHMDIEIVHVEVPDNALNVGEEGYFGVKVTNNGPLAVSNVQVKVKGLNGAQVKYGNGSYSNEFVSDSFWPNPIEAGGGEAHSMPGRAFKFKAPASPQSARNLIRAELHEWDADLGPIMVDSSVGVANVKGTYSSRVFPA